MFVASLTDAEVETLLLALKYWRYHRREATRRSDRALGTDEVEVLLAKLGSGRIAMRGPDDDAFPDLFSQ